MENRKNITIASNQAKIKVFVCYLFQKLYVLCMIKYKMEEKFKKKALSLKDSAKKNYLTGFSIIWSISP